MSTGSRIHSGIQNYPSVPGKMDRPVPIRHNCQNRKSNNTVLKPKQPQQMQSLFQLISHRIVMHYNAITWSNKRAFVTKSKSCFNCAKLSFKCTLPYMWLRSPFKVYKEIVQTQAYNRSKISVDLDITHVIQHETCQRVFLLVMAQVSEIRITGSVHILTSKFGPDFSIMLNAYIVSKLTAITAKFSV